MSARDNDVHLYVDCLEYGTKIIVYDAILFHIPCGFHDQSTIGSCYN